MCLEACEQAGGGPGAVAMAVADRKSLPFCAVLSFDLSRAENLSSGSAFALMSESCGEWTDGEADRDAAMRRVRFDVRARGVGRVAWPWAACPCGRATLRDGEVSKS